MKRTLLKVIDFLEKVWICLLQAATCSRHPVCNFYALIL